MKKPAVNPSFDKFVIDYGTRGQCCGCKRAYPETAPVGSSSYCRQCYSKNGFLSAGKFEKTDAKFCCPCSVRCGAENLSFDQLIVGTCCAQASRWIHEFKFYHDSVLGQIYAESREEGGEAELMVETSDENVDNCRKALEGAIKRAKTAHDQLNDKKKWRKIVQKRRLLVGKAAMKEDNSDLESENEAENNLQNSVERKEGEQCTVCFEIYGEGNRQKSAIIPCGHQACHGCLSSLLQKSCPTCRADFTDDKILKLFPSSQN